MKLLYIILFSIISISSAMSEDNETIFSNIYLGSDMNFNFLTNHNIDNNGLIGNSVKIGYKINSKYACELKLSSSIFDAQSNRLDSSTTLIGKYFSEKHFELLDIKDTKSNLYYLFGVSSTNISSINSQDIKHKVSPSLGVGVEYDLSSTLSFYTDFNFLSTDVSQVSLGINYYFNKADVVDYKKEEIKKIKEEKLSEEEKEQTLSLEERLKIGEGIDEKFDDNKTRLKLKLLEKDKIKKPILVYLYELSSIDEFKRLDYEETVVLKKGDLNGAVLGQIKFLLEPLKMEEFNLILKDETQFFVIVAAIEDQKEIDEWRFIKKIQKNELTEIKLMLNHKKMMEFK